MNMFLKFLNPPQHIPTPTLAPNRGGPVAYIGGPVARIPRYSGWSTFEPSAE